MVLNRSRAIKVMVTGGAGFIGSHVADLLVGNGFQVAVVDNLSTGKRENINPGVSFHQLGITEPELSAVFAQERPDYVIHHAAQVSVEASLVDPIRDATVNILGTVNVLKCCVETGVRKVVYASSAAVYGEPRYLPIDEKHPIFPLSPYGITKHTVEHYLVTYKNVYGLDYTVLRYSNVYGPRQDSMGEGGVVAIFADRLVQGRGIDIFGDGMQTRDFIYVEDVARANLAALDKGSCEIANVSSGQTTSVNQLVEFLRDLGLRADVTFREARKGDIKDSCLDNNKAREVLGWEPRVGLGEGLKMTVNYFK